MIKTYTERPSCKVKNQKDKILGNFFFVLFYILDDISLSLLVKVIFCLENLTVEEKNLEEFSLCKKKV